VYDKNRNHFSTEEALLYWFVDNNYNQNSVKILGYTNSYKYDNNLTDSFEVNSTKQGSEFNISIHNPNRDNFVIIHLQTPEYLWYSRYKDYDDSLNSYCLTHYCLDYRYIGEVNYREIGSGNFKGSEVNITTPKNRNFGVKMYR